MSRPLPRAGLNMHRPEVIELMTGGRGGALPGRSGRGGGTLGGRAAVRAGPWAAGPQMSYILIPFAEPRTQTQLAGLMRAARGSDAR